MTDSEAPRDGDETRRRIRFTRRKRPRPPVWPIVAAVVVLFFLIFLSRYMKA